MFSLLLVGCLLLALVGTPLFAVIFLATATSYSFMDRPLDLTNIFVMMGDLQNKPFLLPIPLFTFAGYLMARSQTPKRIVELADSLFGWLPGGLAIVAICTCAFFTTFTGASGVTIIALGALLYPVLMNRKYPEQFALGVMTSSGSIGLLFFPALPVFIFATVYSLSAGGESVLEPAELFLAGVLPGLLMVVTLCVYAFWTGLRLNIERAPFRMGRALSAVRGALGELLLPVVILLLLQTGKVGINEIASLTAVYVFVLEVFIYRDIHIGRELPKILSESMMLVGAICVILAVILGMNNFLTHAEIPQKILAAMSSFITERWMFLLALNLFLLIIGCLMDIFSAIVAVLPLIIPLALAFDIHPAHLGVIFLANLEIGYMTPPVGMNLFISSFQFEKPVFAVYRSVVPFIGLLAFSLILITYIEPLSTALPNAFLGNEQSTTEHDPGDDSQPTLDNTEILFDDEENLEELYGEEDTTQTEEENLEELYGEGDVTEAEAR